MIAVNCHFTSCFYIFHTENDNTKGGDKRKIWDLVKSLGGWLL